MKRATVNINFRLASCAYEVRPKSSGMMADNKCRPGPGPGNVLVGPLFNSSLLALHLFAQALRTPSFSFDEEMIDDDYCMSSGLK